MSIGLGGQRIITKGLCAPACDGLITTHFSLYCPPPPPKRGGGGPYPANMGAHNQVNNIQDFFTPVHDDIYDPSRTFKAKKEVVIRVNFGNFHMERIYLVPIERANVVVKVLKLLNTTYTAIKINVSRVQRILHNIKISIKNLNRKK